MVDTKSFWAKMTNGLVRIKTSVVTKINKQIFLRKLRRLTTVSCLKFTYEDRWNLTVCFDCFFQKDCINMTNNGIGTNAREETFMETRIPKMNERITTCSIFFSFTTFRQLQNNKVEKNVSHISNVPKCAN